MNSTFFEKSLKVVAHRGDSAFFPENTLPAFLSAAQLGVDCIETDIHLTKDGICVIWHDNSMERTTGDRGLISEKKYKELLSMDAGYMFSGDNGKTYPFRGKGITISTLDEALKSLPEMRFNIDLKDNNLELVHEFARVVRENKAENRVLGASFHDNIIKSLRIHIPEIVTSFSRSEIKKIVLLDKLKILKLHGSFPGEAAQIPEFSGKLKVLTKSLLRVLHRRGVYVHVWTINNREDMLRVLKMGVDTIMTDNPRLLLEILKSPENIF